MWYFIIIGRWSEFRSVFVVHCRWGCMFGEQSVMSGDVGVWLVCVGVLVWRFLLLRMLRCSKCSMM